MVTPVTNSLSAFRMDISSIVSRGAGRASACVMQGTLPMAAADRSGGEGPLRRLVA